MRTFLTTFIAVLFAAMYAGPVWSAPQGRGAATAGPASSAGGPGGRSAAAAGPAPSATSPALVPLLVSPSAPSQAASAPVGGPPRGGLFTGDYDVGSAANGIGFSRHNLGKYGGKGQRETTFDICVYCHTPHRPSDQGGPVWEGAGAASMSFTAYGTSIKQSKVSTVGLGSPSLACLSCHDGSAAPDNIANSPGKKREPQRKTPQRWGYLLNETQMPAYMVNTRILLGPLLTNDHPVNVPFRGGRYASLRPRSTIISRIDLVSGLRSTIPRRISNLWSIKGFISDTATIGDLLRDGRIECSSCHDPHFNNKSWTEAAKTFKGWDDMDGLFLRRVGGNFSSGVCRTCHNK